MGRPIVYCGICGKSLREDDFSKGKAHLVDKTAFCVTCRIVPEPLQRPGSPPPPPSPKPAAPPKPLSPNTPRQHTAQSPAHSSSNALVIGIIVAVLVVILVILVLMNSGGSSPAPRHG
jgi:hypothetical protein